MKKPKKYLVHNYILNPQHPITVILVGVGGNGSLLLTHLARLHLSLRALEHPGLDVTVIDPDTVSASNVGRQAFSIHDIKLPKAYVAVTRVNLFYNLKWKWQINEYSYFEGGNITITCTDNVKSRLEVKKAFDNNNYKSEIRHPNQQTYLYWLDVGNLRDRGQVVLGSADGKLKDVTALFGEDYKDADPTQEPSCSLAEALQRQDLCINPMMTTFALKLLWDMFTKGILDYHGFLINLEDLTFNKLTL